MIKSALLLLKIAATEVLRMYSLFIVTEAQAPFAMKSGMKEVILSDTRLVIGRTDIIDIAVIFPLFEVESIHFQAESL
jgi:hypothetical protein